MIVTITSASRVVTVHGDLYCKKMCRHFAHKIPADYEGFAGRIEFPVGVCVISTDAEGIDLQVSASNEEDISRLENVVADHLLRMATKDEPLVDWERAK